MFKRDNWDFHHILRLCLNKNRDTQTPKHECTKWRGGATNRLVKTIKQKNRKLKK